MLVFCAVADKMLLVHSAVNFRIDNSSFKPCLHVKRFAHCTLEYDTSVQSLSPPFLRFFC